MWTKRKRRQMTYLHRGRNGNVDKCILTMDETETLTNVILTMEWTKRGRKRRQMSYLPTWTKQKHRKMSNLQCGRNGNVDKCHTYNVDETETSTNVIVTMWTKRKRRQMSNLNVNETETSTNVILKMWTKRKRRQMTYLHRGRNGNVDKWHTYNGDETETLTNVILTMETKRKRGQISYLPKRNRNVDKCHTYRRELWKMSRNGNVDKCHT